MKSIYECFTRHNDFTRHNLSCEKLRAACEAFEGRLKAVVKNKGGKIG